MGSFAITHNNSGGADENDSKPPYRSSKNTGIDAGAVFEPDFPMSRRIEWAITAVNRTSPIHGALLMSIPVRECSLPNFPMATDGITIMIDPEKSSDMPPEVFKSGIAHEAEHVLMKHPFVRRDGFDKRTLEMAMEYEVNSSIGELFPAAKTEFVYDKQFEGLSFRTIYDILEQEDDEKKDQRSHGFQPDQIPNEDPNDEVVATAMARQAVQAAKDRGQIPGDQDGFAHLQDVTVAGWPDLIRQELSGETKTSFARPNPLSASGVTDIILPHKISEKVTEKVVCIVDTSGSVSQREFNMFMGAFASLVSEYFPEKLIIYLADTHVRHKQEITDISSMVESLRAGGSPIKIRGGGGTDFNVPLKQVSENEPDVDSVFYLTDGEATPPNVPPGLEVTWLLTQPNDKLPGQKIMIDGEARW